MSLEGDLKAKTLQLISQQMANWVVEIQRQIADHQGNLVRTLDELQEAVARYDEKINEGDIEAAMTEVVTSQPPPVPVGPGFDKLKASLAEVEKGTSLSEVLTYLVNEVAQYVDRTAMFIVKGPSAIGWYGRGFDHPEIVKQVTVPLNADTVFRIVHNAKHALRGHVTHSPGTAQALARLGGHPQGVLAVPLVLRDKLAAILYCDTQQEEVPASEGALIEILVLAAGKNIDILSLAPKTAPGAAPRAPTAVTTPERPPVAAAPRSAAPAAPPLPAESEGSSTVVFNASMFAPKAAPAAPPRQAPVPPTGPQPILSPEEQKAHEDAKRFARLVVSEIKLYNEAKVNEGRRNKDLYERLKEDIERGRQMYSDRVASPIRESTNYFFDELVRILAGGDPSALGPM